jgi:hypothetical protein
MADRIDQINQLIHDMHAAPAEEAQAVCRRLLRITLVDGLTPTAWDVLEAVVDEERLWQWKELPTLLQQYKLPTERDALRKAIWANGGTGVNEDPS